MATGAWGTLEHPEDLGAPAASVFHSQPMYDLLAFCTNSRVFGFDQCQCSATSRKPTGIWTNDRYLQQSSPGRCSHRGGHQAAIGIQGGVFRTTALSKYPPAMCAWLAHASQRKLQQGAQRQPFSAVAGAWRPAWHSRAVSPQGFEGEVLRGVHRRAAQPQN